MGTVARHLPSCLSLSDLTAMATATAMAMATRTAASDYTAAMPGFTEQGMDMATHTADTRTAQDMDMVIHTLAMDTADMAVSMVVMDMVIHTISASKSSQEVVLDGIFHADEIASICKL